MKVALSVGLSRQHHAIEVELPDDYVLGPSIYLDIQLRVLAMLADYQAKGAIAPCFIGIDGDPVFRERLDKYFGEQATKTRERSRGE